MKANLCLHTGANKVERGQLARVITPERTATWVPIAHDRLVAGILGTLHAHHLTLVNESHGLTRDGSRYFGLLQVANGHNADDFGMVIGVRNSHDKSFPAGLVVGASVFVCDNLSFSGEIKLARKHTSQIERDLPQLITRAMGLIVDHRDKQEQRFASYKSTEFTDAQAHDLIIRAVDTRVCPWKSAADVVQEWRRPRHSEFAQGGKTAWRLFNAFTEALKGNLGELPRRTQTLHGLLDLACEVQPAPLEPATTLRQIVAEQDAQIDELRRQLDDAPKIIRIPASPAAPVHVANNILAASADQVEAIATQFNETVQRHSDEPRRIPSYAFHV